MILLRTALTRFEARCERCWMRLDSPRVLAACALLVPLAFGLLSLLFGQDDNWDLHNYHLYNPYALMHGKIGFDLAPAQWQSYFNPTLDLLYYGLTRTLPAPLVGFIMGWLHGLNFVLVLGIARCLLQAGAAPRYRLPLLLALAGCLGPGFLSELGNTMGDNMTALCVLGALLLLLGGWAALERHGARGAAIAFAAGLAMGIGTGLKLTNATYAVALCLALLTVGGSLWLRLRAAFVFGVGVLGGIAAGSGYWYWKMWQLFGNPLFPQFNDKFHAALAAPIGIGDTGWLPKGMAEKLLWPFIFTLHPKRVIELPLTQLIWPMLYLLFCALALRKLRAAILGRDSVPAMSAQARFVLLFFALAYLCWLNLFGIYRYLVPLELLAPLAFWLVAHGLMRASFARRVAGFGVLLATAVIFPISTWGHAPWSRASFGAEVPVFERPSDNMVFTVHGDPPMGWLVPLFPDTLAFVALGSGFPESPAYAARVADMMAARSGPIYVMLQADRHDPGQSRPPEEAQRAADNNRVVLEKAQEILTRYRITLNPDSCKAYPAFVGASRHDYQLCTVNPPR